MPPVIKILLILLGIIVVSVCSVGGAWVGLAIAIVTEMAQPPGLLTIATGGILGLIVAAIAAIAIYLAVDKLNKKFP